MHRHDIVSLMNKLSKCVSICQHMQAMAAVPLGRGGRASAKGPRERSLRAQFLFFFML